MVLTDLGKRLASALDRVNASPAIDEQVLNELLKEVGNALMAADVNFALVAELKQTIRRRVQEIHKLPQNFTYRKRKKQLVQKVLIEELSNLLSSPSTPFKPQRGSPNVIMFVGLQGSGKTTTCVKLAHHYHMFKWRVGLVCADTFRAGALAQMKMNAVKAKVPYYGRDDESDPVVIAREGVDQFKRDGFEIIIVDTSGRHKQESALFEEMEMIARVVNPNEVIFVMDSTIGQAARPQAIAFSQSVDIGSVIMTKLDGHSKGGGALSAVAATKSPITFIGTGEHIGDLQEFDTTRFVKKLLGLGDIWALKQQFELLDPDEESKKSNKAFARNLIDGKLTLRDFRDQFQNLMKLGPVGNLMQMIPGMSKIMPEGSEQDAQKKIKTFMTIMDSMTEKELDSDIKIFSDTSRQMRIARGAGAHPREVQQLLDAFKPFQRRGKRNPLIPRNKKNLDPENMNAKQLASLMNPQMLKKLGGQAGLQKMMRELENGETPGQMENLASMMKQMQK